MCLWSSTIFNLCGYKKISYVFSPPAIFRDGVICVNLRASITAVTPKFPLRETIKTILFLIIFLKSYFENNILNQTLRIIMSIWAQRGYRRLSLENKDSIFLESDHNLQDFLRNQI